MRAGLLDQQQKEEAKSHLRMKRFPEGLVDRRMYARGIEDGKKTQSVTNLRAINQPP